VCLEWRRVTFQQIITFDSDLDLKVSRGGGAVIVEKFSLNLQILEYGLKMSGGCFRDVRIYLGDMSGGCVWSGGVLIFNKS
jgi:hypothetical protein